MSSFRKEVLNALLKIRVTGTTPNGYDDALWNGDLKYQHMPIEYMLQGVFVKGLLGPLENDMRSHFSTKKNGNSRQF